MFNVNVIGKSDVLHITPVKTLLVLLPDPTLYNSFTFVGTLKQFYHP